ncbi:MAG: inorganic phosphate transporter, partial [Anaerolineae bacterium]|nr:inorganic phosphate transporter [Anaerolineae bacterium]
MHFSMMAAIIVLAIGYGYLNGLHGSASIVATLISSRSLNPRGALMLAALGVTIGPFLFGVAVANTIGAKLISGEASTAAVVVAALISTLAWSSLTFRLSIPSSISQTLVGSLIGAAWAGYGHQAILAGGLKTTLAGLFLSPVLGLIVGFLLIRLILRLSASATPHINRWFRRGQVIISFFMAMSFGANDSQKMMGVITLGLVAT